MRKPLRSSEDPSGSMWNAESLFRSKPISEIRHVETSTKREVEEKKEELRQLVGKSYRDLIDSADSIINMKSSCESISSNISQIEIAIKSLSDTSETPKVSPNPSRVRLYDVASRVKYLVDTPENIWGCLDESMFLEASGRYLRAKVVHGLIVRNNVDRDFLSNFPLLQHQWQIVESFKLQISQRSRERLMDQGLGVSAYADALSAVATIDELNPKQVLSLFLDSRRSWISRKLGMCSKLDSATVSEVFFDVVRIIQVTIGQVGELFLQVLNDMPLFYKTVLGSPPGTQLFGGVPNPNEEVKLWKLHRERLESKMMMLESEFVSKTCSDWLKICGKEIFGQVNGRHLIDVIQTGEELALAERLIRGTLDGREALEGSMEWLRSVFGSEIESPWNQIHALVLKDDKDLWDGMFEDAFVYRMKEIIHSGFEALRSAVNVTDSVRAVVASPVEPNDFQSYLKKASSGGEVWFSELSNSKAGTVSSFKAMTDGIDFHNCFNSYLGPEVGWIRDVVDSRCMTILEDLLCFLESQKSRSRLKELVPYLQNTCYGSISTILKELEDELQRLLTALGNSKEENDSQSPAIVVERSLFIGRLLFALRNHSINIPLILGSPRIWVTTQKGSALFGKLPSTLRSPKIGFDSPVVDIPKRQMLDSPMGQTSSATAALFSLDDSANPKLDELNKTLRDLCIKAHSLWTMWVSDKLSLILSKDLEKDDALSSTTPLMAWEEIPMKQELSNEGAVEMKIALPCMPSLYITSFLFQACQEIHMIGGHVLDKFILQHFAFRLLEKVVGIYQHFLSSSEARTPPVSDKGLLQILLDLRFTVDILSGGKESSFSNTELSRKEEQSKNLLSKSPLIRKHVPMQPNSAIRERVMGLIHNLSQKLDPIDWATYEPYLWDNEKQSYQRHAVLFGLLVQLNRMYTDTAKKVPMNTAANILRCSTIPRFNYLPISAPQLSSRGMPASSLSTTSADISSRSSWKAYSNGELSPELGFDDTSSIVGATPLFKSFMTQVGSRFGESTLRLGSMLSDGQVGRLKDNAMLSFGDIIPVHAAGLLSSFTAGSGRPDS